MNVPQPRLSPIPAGWFQMGSEAGQDNERPVHRAWVDAFRWPLVRLPTPTTPFIWRRQTRRCPPTWDDHNLNHPRQPVVSVSWFEALKYCEWLTATSSRQFRLPTEAEWERAARGGMEGKLFAWGDDLPQSRPDYERRWRTGPEPVATQPPNPYGLYDISENVHEWCSDWFQADYYTDSPERNPKGPDTGERKASRGGSWRHHIKISRCAARASIPPAFQYADYGFRVACDLT